MCAATARQRVVVTLLEPGVISHGKKKVRSNNPGQNNRDEENVVV